jgi:hypothetical protein
VAARLQRPADSMQPARPSMMHVPSMTHVPSISLLQRDTKRIKGALCRFSRPIGWRHFFGLGPPTGSVTAVLQLGARAAALTCAAWVYRPRAGDGPPWVYLTCAAWVYCVGIPTRLDLCCLGIAAPCCDLGEVQVLIRHAMGLDLCSAAPRSGRKPLRSRPRSGRESLCYATRSIVGSNCVDVCPFNGREGGLCRGALPLKGGRPLKGGSREAFEGASPCAATLRCSLRHARA